MKHQNCSTKYKSAQVNECAEKRGEGVKKPPGDIEIMQTQAGYSRRNEENEQSNGCGEK